MVRTTLKELIIQCTSNMGDKSSTVTRTTAMPQISSKLGSVNQSSWTMSLHLSSSQTNLYKIRRKKVLRTYKKFLLAYKDG